MLTKITARATDAPLRQEFLKQHGIAVTTGLRNVATAVMSSAKFSGEESRWFLLQNARH